MDDKRKKLNILYETVMKQLVQAAREEMPETGTFRRITVVGYCKGSPLRSILGIEESYSSETQRYITFGMYREGEDRITSNYLFKGTKQEVLAWLETPENREQVIDAYEHLEDKAKEW